METESTTISLAKIVRDRLRTFGNKGETYDIILNRIMDSGPKTNAFREIMDFVDDPETSRLYLHKEKTGANVDMFFVKKDNDERTKTVYISDDTPYMEIEQKEAI